MKRMFWYISSALLCTLVFGLATAAAPDQPRMEAARADLQAAKAELQRAEHNKGGHRANAIGYINSAIAAVNRGIQFDRRHNHAEASSAASAVAPDQPHMRAALASLENAKRNLEAATADKGGFRKQAIELTEKAIAEVRKGIAAGA